MLSKVSWSEFVVGTVILLVLYYLVLGLKYYQKEIKALLSGKSPFPGKATKSDPQQQSLENLSDSSFDELEAVVNDLRHAILERNGKHVGKKELLEQLQDRLENYAGLQNPAYRVAINNYIIVHAKELCGAVFSESELNEAWDTLPR